MDGNDIPVSYLSSLEMGCWNGGIPDAIRRDGVTRIRVHLVVYWAAGVRWMPIQSIDSNPVASLVVQVSTVAILYFITRFEDGRFSVRC